MGNKNISPKESLINEYFNNKMVTLNKYLNLTIDEKKQMLPYMYPLFYDIFSVENSIYIDIPYSFFNSPDDEKQFNINDYNQFINWLKLNHPDIFNSFASYLYVKIVNFELNINVTDYPTWAFFGSPNMIKNGWLIHFTNNPIDIAKNGFIYGINEHFSLGLTAKLEDSEKILGGYNFAYDINDYYKFCYVNDSCPLFNYGDYAVVFNASGLKTYHYGDEEYQVIFYGNTAKNIIPIISGDNNIFGVRNKFNEHEFYYESSDIENVVNWILNNYHQYRKKIIWR